jgi:mRNA interferase RelE/StbE
MYTVRLHAFAEKQYRKLPVEVSKKVDKVLESLEQEPFQGKKLQGKLAGLYSIRTWPYRVVYVVEKKVLVVLVLDIEHRKDIYR